MLRKLGVAAAVGVISFSSLLIPGCSDDSSPTGPGNPGTGTKVDAGTYAITLSQWTCGMMDTMSIGLNEVMCADFSFDELFELDCSVNIVNGNSFTIDCATQVDDGGCTYTEQVQVAGTLSGTTWTVEGTITITSETPPGCSGEPTCAGVRVVLERTGAPPSACIYAEANTVDATMVGGPFAGNTAFGTRALARGGVGSIHSWVFAGGASTFKTTPRQPDHILNLANFEFRLMDIDANALPATFGITVMNEGPQGFLPSGSAQYDDLTTEGTYFYSTGGSGSITVHEVSDIHIAGTIDALTFEGLQGNLDGGEPVPSTRSMSGGFHVRQEGDTPTKPGLSGWMDRTLQR